MTPYARLMAILEHTAEPVPCRASPHPAAWIADRPDEQSVAARACQPCPALNACAHYARTAREPAGVWGGKTLAERFPNRRPQHHDGTTERTQ